MADWVISDSQTTVLDGFTVDALPPSAYPYVTPKVLRSNWGRTTAIALEAGPYVGALPLTTGETLLITPRVGAPTFARMLSVASRLNTSVRREFEEFVKLGYGSNEDSSWLELLGRSFTQQLRVIETNGLLSDRVEVKRRLGSAKGRIDVTRTLTSQRRREAQPVHAVTRQRTTDIFQNRVIAMAARALLMAGVLKEREAATAARWGMSFAAASASDLEAASRSLAGEANAGARAYYIPALVMAELIVAQTGIDLEGPERVSAEPLLTNVYTMYEEYLRVVLSGALTEDGYLVEKLEPTGAPTLFTDGTAQLNADIVISDRRGRCLLVDAKYKLSEAVVSSDYYQMAAYMKGFQLPVGMLVRPRLDAQTQTPVKRTMRYGGAIYELNVGMQAPDFGEEAFITEVRRVLTDVRRAPR